MLRLHKQWELAAGQELRFAFFLGEGRREAGLAVRQKFWRTPPRDEAMATLRALWDKKCSALQIDTPATQ